MIKSTFEIEEKLREEGHSVIIGIDEAGRGPLAGPVVACATTVRNFQFPISNFQTNQNSEIQNDKMWDLIRDSKTLSEKQREKVFDFVMENFHVGIGVCDHQTIDRINILEASFLAMKKAINSLERVISNFQFPISSEFPMNNLKNAKKIILLDGNKQIPNFSGEQKAIVSGDKLVKSISAASIVAKVTRDRMMLELHEKYPEYGFDKHKGYGTKFHMDALLRHGASPIHRRSFAPVKRCQR